MAFVGSTCIGTRARPGAALSVRKPRAAGVTMVAKSKSVPFLDAPKKLNGTLVGDVGFDPLYLTDYINLDYARSAELKHGRICMLACLGFVVQEHVQLPGEMFSETNPLLAIYKAPTAGWFQILAFISAIELATFKKNYDGSPPGDYGFDPLKLGKDPATKAKYAENEIVHCRAAMIGFLGFFLQNLVTGQGVLDQLWNFKSLM